MSGICTFLLGPPSLGQGILKLKSLPELGYSVRDRSVSSHSWGTEGLSTFTFFGGPRACASVRAF